MAFDSIMERFRWSELLIRKIYYSNDKIHSLMSNKYQSIASEEKGADIETEASWEKIKETINGFGIENGDILIVHSSADGLARIKKTPKEMTDYLMSLVGDKGTLVMAAYPNLEKKDDEGNILYDPKRTAVTTGLLPFLFCRRPGTIRSSCPLDSLAANGPEAEAMMHDNLETDLAFGKNSAWEYCVNHRAKILFFGVPIYHSNTVTHVVEDLMDEKWPVKGWYEENHYSIRNGEETIIKTYRSRKQSWAEYTTQHWNTALYKKNGLVTEKVVDGVSIGFNPNAKALVEFLEHRAEKGKLPFVIPRKYRR